MHRFRKPLVAVMGVAAVAIALALPAQAQSSSPSSGGADVVLRVGVVADLGTDNVFAVSGGSTPGGRVEFHDIQRFFAERSQEISQRIGRKIRITRDDEADSLVVGELHLRHGAVRVVVLRLGDPTVEPFARLLPRVCCVCVRPFFDFQPQVATGVNLQAASAPVQAA